MQHIKTPNDIPGIIGLFAFRPETAEPMNQLAEILLRQASSLLKWERELIAAYVSHLNECTFCYNTHSAMARHWIVSDLTDDTRLKDDKSIIEAVMRDYLSAPISEKLKALLTIASKVQEDARKVLPKDIEAARNQGATDMEIHDTVLIAAAFCMYNKYVDGLGTLEWEEPGIYDERARLTAENGYSAKFEANVV